MGINCPNKNTPEWIMLVEQVGEDMAMLTYLQHGQSLPEIKSLSKTKRELLFRPNEERLERIYSNIKNYNRRNGTSHYIIKTKSYGNTFDLELKLNYLPVNVEKQRQKKAESNLVYKIDNIDIQSFTEQYPTNDVKDIYENPILSFDSNIEAIDSEGNIVHPDNVYENEEDYLIVSAKDQVTQAEKLRRNKIQSEVVQTKDQLSKATDSFVIRNLLSRLEQLSKQLSTAEQRVIATDSVNTFENVLLFADSQLKEVENLLSKESISADNILFAQRIINLWRKAGDFSGNSNEHIILDQDEVNSPDIKNEFRLRGNLAEDLESRLNPIREDHIISFVRKYTNENMTKDQIFSYLKDSSKLSALTLNLGRNEDLMLQALYSGIESANIKARTEANNIWEKFDQLTSKVLPKLKKMNSSGNPWRVFEQLSKSGKGTGKLLHRFSTEFFNTINDLKFNAFQKRDSKTGEIKISKPDIEKYYKWLNDNTISFDARKLFNDEQLNNNHFNNKFLFNNKFNENDKLKHINELKSQLGQKGYDFYYDKVKEKIEKFKLDREVIWDSIDLKNLTSEEKEQQFEDWNKENSPFWGSELLENPSMRIKSDKKSFYQPNGINNYSYQVPKKIINGKVTNWYDSNFEKIENDNDLLEYYNNMLEVLKELKSFLPKDKQKLMGINDIPKMKASLIDNFSEKGMMMGIKPFWDAFQEMKTTTDLSTTEQNDIDPLTNQKNKQINIQFIEDTKQKINAIVRNKVIKYKLDNNIDPTKEILREFREDAQYQLSQENSFDLTKIMKAYSVMALGYKHKSFIEPHVKMVDQAFRSKQEIVTNKAGIAKTQDGKIITQEGLANLKSQLDFYLDTNYWSIGGRKVEGVTKKKAYTSKDKEKLKELEELKEKSVNEEDINHLQDQIDKLGGVITGSAIGDTALKFMTYRGLAYNIGSAFSNLGFGVISNIIQSADAREFSTSQMRKAYLLSINSIGKNITFDKWEGVNQNALKIRTLIDKWDLLKTSNKELYDTSNKSSVVKGLGRFGPMSLQERSEYLNYSPVMIATMLNIKAKDDQGNEINLWDAYDVNGSLKEGYSSDLEETKLVLKIKRIIEMSHGDYNNSLQIKQTIGGRALSQFRTWMFEGFASRFESEKEDVILGYGKETPYIRKGRYKSYTKGQLATAGATLGTTILPGLGTVIGAGTGLLVGKFFGMQTEESGLSDTLFALKQLARKLVFKKTQFDERFNETDSANMRKNMTELYVLMAVAGVALMITAIAGDDDEEKIPAANFLLNQMTRMHTDIAFYSNPLEFEKLTKSSVPIMQLITDSKEWFVDVSKLYDEDSDEDIFQSGPFKGQSKLLIHTGEIIPGSAQVIKTIRSVDKVY